MSKALIVVDVQNGFTREGALASPACEEVIPNIVKVVEQPDFDNGLVIFTRDSHVTNDREFEVFPEHCVEGTSEQEIVDELQPFLKEAIRFEPTDRADRVIPSAEELAREWDRLATPNGLRARVIDKRRYSALFETRLGTLIDVRGITEVDIVGICTDICVLHTAADLRNRDIKVRVISDATATFDAPGHNYKEAKENALAHIKGILGAEVI